MDAKNVQNQILSLVIENEYVTDKILAFANCEIRIDSPCLALKAICHESRAHLKPIDLRANINVAILTEFKIVQLKTHYLNEVVNREWLSSPSV